MKFQGEISKNTFLLLRIMVGVAGDHLRVLQSTILASRWKTIKFLGFGSILIRIEFKFMKSTQK